MEYKRGVRENWWLVLKKIEIGKVNKESEGSGEYAVQGERGGFKFSRAIKVH